MAIEDLHGFIEEVTGESHLRVEEDLGGGFVRLRTSEAERRQAQQDIRSIEDVALELLRNARDAGAHAIYIATGRSGNVRHVCAIDDGEGIPEELWEAVFEPRVTSKLESFHTDQWGVHGRGMALFSIKCNTEEARVVSSELGKGSALRIRSDVGKLAERSDQSTLPHLVRGDDGRVVVRGPRNINRIVAEFTLNQKGSCQVFIGSDTEVLATLVAHGERTLGALERALAGDVSDYPLCLRPSLAGDAEELAETAASLGLELSVRGARRILDGEVAPLKPFAALLNESFAKQEHGSASHRAPGKGKARAGRVRMDAADLERFGSDVSRAFKALAEQYYLEDEVQANVALGRERITITIPILPKD